MRTALIALLAIALGIYLGTTGGFARLAGVFDGEAAAAAHDDSYALETPYHPSSCDRAREWFFRPAVHPGSSFLPAVIHVGYPYHGVHYEHGHHEAVHYSRTLNVRHAGHGFPHHALPVLP